MILRASLIFVAALFLVSCTHSPSRSDDKWDGYFPEEVKGIAWYNKALTHREPRLYRDGDLDGYTYRLRLSIVGIRCTAYVIRIDERASGWMDGMVRHYDRCRNGPVESHRFVPSRAKVAELKALIGKAGMFEYYPETWKLQEEGSICLDGHQLLFERRDASGYGLSESNASCTTPLKVREVAEKMVAMSGEKSALANLIP